MAPGSTRNRLLSANHFHHVMSFYIMWFYVHDAFHNVMGLQNFTFFVGENVYMAFRRDLTIQKDSFYLPQFIQLNKRLHCYNVTHSPFQMQWHVKWLWSAINASLCQRKIVVTGPSITTSGHRFHLCMSPGPVGLAWPTGCWAVCTWFLGEEDTFILECNLWMSLRSLFFEEKKET